MNENLTLALCGGGTGGHIIPALAVGREFVRQVSDARLIYIGNPGSLEERLAKSHSIEFFPIEVKPLRRGVIFPNLTMPFLAVSSIIKAGRILRSNKVNLVFGSGGFSSWPGCAAARFGGMPYFLTDGNAFPGLVTRLLGRKASRIYIAFSEIKNNFKNPADNFLLTGFPVSEAIGKLTKSEARVKLGIRQDKTTILVTGGSGGARSINKAVSQIKQYLLAKDYNLIWQTGNLWDTDKETVHESLGQMLIAKFFEPSRMAEALSAADLAITRCGIMTLSELAVAGLPAVMIPFPFSAEGHQEANARAIESSGGGVMIRDTELTPEKLFDTIESLLESDRLKSMQEGILRFARPDAASRIVRDMLGSIDA